MIVMPRCEVCGEEATTMVRDITEVDTGPEGDGWRKFEPKGGSHALCEEHKRASVTYDTDGVVLH